MAEEQKQSQKIQIIVAVITAGATLCGALIANWDKIFNENHQSNQDQKTATVVVVTPLTQPNKSEEKNIADPPPEIQVAGLWHDALNSRITLTIGQTGGTIRTTLNSFLPNGVTFQSDGRGSIVGQTVTTTYIATYQTGERTAGECRGYIRLNASVIDWECTDNFFGSFKSQSVRG